MSTFGFGHLYLACDDGGEVPRVDIVWNPTHGKEGKGAYDVTFSSGDRLAPRFTITLASHQFLPFLGAIETQGQKALDDFHTTKRGVYS